MKILHYGLSSNMGGIETYLYKIYSNINRERFEFCFINTNEGKACFEDELIKLGAVFFKVTPRNKSLLKNKQEIENIFRNERIDILHMHLNTLSYIDPIFIALKYNCKVIVHSRNGGAYYSPLTNILHKINFHRVPQKKIKMLAVSDIAGEWLFGKNANFVTINNGINIEKFKFNILKREKLRAELGLNNRFVIGNIGTFLPVKNHEFTVNVFKEIKKKNKEAKLILVGSGPLEEQIKTIVKQYNLQEDILLLGKRTDIPEILSALDVLLFPSLFEGFPNVVLEAQTNGLPCIISDKITKQVVINNDCLRIPLELSAEEWANEILKLEIKKDRVKDAEIINKLGFSVAEEIKKIENIYNELNAEK